MMAVVFPALIASRVSIHVCSSIQTVSSASIGRTPSATGLRGALLLALRLLFRSQVGVAASAGLLRGHGHRGGEYQECHQHFCTAHRVLRDHYEMPPF